MEIRLRLAPSPTGLFHIGTARTALFNWLQAKKDNGKFLIRIEDTDSARSKNEYKQNILNGLQWLGLNWDENLLNQSERISIHKEIIQHLLDEGFAYRCFTSEEEIQHLREEQKKNGLPPRHDNRHRNLTKEQIKQFISNGKSSVVRFKIDDDIEIKWQDMIRGEIQWIGKDLGGDMVLSRRATGYEIGSPLYNLVVVVDDNYMRISHVVRGEDHISNTAKQILIYKALNYTLPIFAHAPLILNDEGKKLSKRDSVTSIDEFKEMGYLPEALSNYMVLLGWSPKNDENEIKTLYEISKIFDLKNINKSGAKFSWEKLNWINSQYIKKMKLEELHNIFSVYWREMGWNEPSKSWGIKLTMLLKDSIIVLKDAIDQSAPFFIAPALKQSGEDFLKNNDVSNLLNLILNYLNENQQVFDEEVAKEILGLVSKKLSIKKGILMKSLRVAFFGCLSGPDLIQSWVLLSEKEEDIPRIKKCLNLI